MNNFTMMIVLINIIIVMVGVGFFTSTSKNTNLELEKLKLERDKFEFEKHKFDEMETNKYTYLLHKMKHDMIMKTMEVENLSNMNRRDNETKNSEINAMLQERSASLKIEKEKATEQINAMLKKTQIENGLNFKDDIVDTFDNIIRLQVETHMYNYVLQRNSIDTINPEDIAIPVGVEYEKQLTDMKNKIRDNLGFEAVTIFDRYMKRDMWENMLFDMLSVYWSKSINIAKARKIQLATVENKNLAADSRKPALFINGSVNPKCGLSPQMITLIQDLKIKNKEGLSKVIDTLQKDSGNMFETSMYKPLADIKLNDYR